MNQNLSLLLWRKANGHFLLKVELIAWFKPVIPSGFIFMVIVNCNSAFPEYFANAIANKKPSIVIKADAEEVRILVNDGDQFIFSLLCGEMRIDRNVFDERESG